jgi:hypothetical protein
MARGWESKSVEQQQDEMVNPSKSSGPRLSPVEKANNRKREGLLLSRKRLVQQLANSSRPRHRQMLEQAIAEIDNQLSSFDPLTGPPGPK